MATDTVVASGFSFTEGPCVDAQGVLHVVELANRCVSKVVDGERVVLAELGGSPNGAAFGPDGELYVCNGGGHWGANASTRGEHGLGGQAALIQRVSADGSFETVVSEIDGRPLNSPNDICFDAEGGFYFTDPRWPPRNEDLSHDLAGLEPGDVCYVSPSGEARRVHSGLLFPNGLQVTPDGSGLIVDETGTGLVHGFPIVAPGSLGPIERYADLGEGSGPDGMCLDSDGSLLVAGHGSYRIYVVAPGGGEVERTLEFEDPEVTNCCFGGPDMRTLYVTQASLGLVVSVAWEVPGMVLHPDRARRASA